MRKMQAMQPELKAIQDRYAKLKMSDPARAKMNRRSWTLYKRARRQSGERLRADAPDAAGALRVLLAALGRDRVARRAVHPAGFTTCRRRTAITSWPVLMGVTMFVQQRMTPATGDPTQQKMMIFMPIMMTVCSSGRQRPGDLLDRQQHAGASSSRPSPTGSSVRRWSATSARRPSARCKTNPSAVARPTRRRSESHEQRPGQGRTLVRNVGGDGAAGARREGGRHARRDPHRDHGEGGEVLLKRKGEALDALQQIVNTGSAANSTTTAASSSTAWAIARARTKSCGR